MLLAFYDLKISAAGLSTLLSLIAQQPTKKTGKGKGFDVSGLAKSMYVTGLIDRSHTRTIHEQFQW